MKRRDFITVLGGAAAWPLAARAQQQVGVRRIGWLSQAAQDEPSSLLNRFNAFKRGLADLGWIERRNVAFEERWARNDPDKLRSSASELAGLRPNLIFVANSPSLAAVRRATGSIPIVFASIIDPVGQGFVSSLAQPGGNITGFAADEFEMSTKKLELLKKIAPEISHVVFMYDPSQPAAPGIFAATEAVAASLGVQLSKAPVRDASEIERAFEALPHTPNVGIFLDPSPAITANQVQIVTEATQRRLPSIHTFRAFAVGGALASYGPDDLDLCRRAASYGDRILKGETPANLPVQAPTKFETVLNLKTAKAIGLNIPPGVLAIADEVIE